MKFKQLEALIKSSDWQISLLENDIKLNMERLEKMDQDIADIKQTIESASPRPGLINPEEELTRLGYISHQYQRMENLRQERATVEEQMENLRHQLSQAKSKHKMLGRLLERQMTEAKLQRQLVQEKQLEDFILMRDHS